MFKIVISTLLVFLLVLMGYYQCQEASNLCYTREEAQRWKSYHACLRTHRSINGILTDEKNQEACFKSIFNVTLDQQ